MSMPRKRQRAMIMQSFRLMMSSGVLRTPAVDPEQLTRPWMPPQPNAAPTAAPRPPVHAWFRRTAVGMFAFLTLSLFSVSMAHAVRVKDVATIEGVRENQLIGYGLVVGLDRTGDQVIGGQFTIQAMMSMLNKMGINLVIDPIQLLTRNIASVMVTAKLPPVCEARHDARRRRLFDGQCEKSAGRHVALDPVKSPQPAGLCRRSRGRFPSAGFWAAPEGQAGRQSRKIIRRQGWFPPAPSWKKKSSWTSTPGIPCPSC
jgi:hypothetical protein